MIYSFIIIHSHDNWAIIIQWPWDTSFNHVSSNMSLHLGMNASRMQNTLPKIGFILEI